MLGYNKFAVSENDLIGNWKGGAGAWMQLFSTITGNNVGMEFSSMSDSFSFNSGGNYQSNHSGASGINGTIQTYKGKFIGKYSINEWSITLTNRENGRTTNFDAYFEAVKGGVILHFSDKQYSTSVFDLGKVK